MRALVATANPKFALELREVDEPTAAPNEALIEVHAVSINRGELRLIGARPAGWRPGQDVAGVIARAAEDGSGPAVGTRVVALVDQAGWSERVPASVGRIGILPEGVSFSQAAGLPVAGLTALRTLRLGGTLLGRSVLVTGASGGVGHFAVQLAARSGARVTGISRDLARGEALVDSGDVRIAADSTTLQGPFDLILESVGGESLTAALRLVAPGGTIAFFGNSSGEESRLAFGSIMSAPHSRLCPFFVYASGEPPSFGADLTLLANEIGAGRLTPQVGLEGSWREPLAALEAVRERHLLGKAVLSID
ncbi:MAG TPA: zinc-binding dehydrogenase [Chloroflexota bacterium]|nr:zinc-binding dehydrogenase [Chloroflexota bacterium]